MASSTRSFSLVPLAKSILIMKDYDFFHTGALGLDNLVFALACAVQKERVKAVPRVLELLSNGTTWELAEVA